jgi:hypothetical protein
MCALATLGPPWSGTGHRLPRPIFLSGELPDAVSSLDVVFADGERATITPTQGFFAYPISPQELASGQAVLTITANTATATHSSPTGSE